MCDFCGRTPCAPNCPNMVEQVHCTCDYCQEPIYAECEYYDFNGEIVCEDCLDDWISDHKCFAEREYYERDWDAIIKAEKEEAYIKELENGKL